MGRALGVIAAGAALCAFLSSAGARATETARCEGRQPNGHNLCWLARYNVQFSGHVTYVNSAYPQSWSIDIRGSYRRLRVTAEIMPPRPRVPHSTINIYSQEGRGSLTTSLRLQQGNCTFAKTYRRPVSSYGEHVSGGVVLGWKPTAREVRRLGGTVWLQTGFGDEDFNPVLSGCPDWDGMGLTVRRAIPGGFTSGYIPNDIRKNGLAVSPLDVAYERSGVSARQTMRRMTFPLNRLWAERSFVLSGRGRTVTPNGDGVTQTDARITFTRIR